ncbi:diguanylate cyclase domain-containing protein [Gloeothece verrucosa]|uniref:Diguanylate cyclase with PAS/PAC sensor n=1 Tax=Gloeothece verrucosa (strain PCC 7822) TaxID=497965 RepID=E0UDU4_GLOV7|nr:diguanylate cyclase [Gloeothece verrucosa]ADN16529.1 diguanylate cyclase with PAS/PAC sensor [Gloeothece verrucosa PCC 7822]
MSAIVPIFTAVSLVAYFSYKNTQQVIDKLADQLMSEVDNRVHQYLETYLATPHRLNLSNANAVALGQLNLLELKEVERFLYWQSLNYPYLPDIMFANERGDFRIADYIKGKRSIWAADYPNIDKINQYAIDSTGQRIHWQQTLPMPDGDIRKRPWYQLAKRTQAARWSTIFTLGDDTDLTINASLPIYEPKTKRLRGVFGVHIYLSRINQFLQQIQVAQSGVVFIIEPNGLLVASSTKELPYLKTNHNTFKRLSAIDSKYPTIQVASRSIISTFKSFSQINRHEHLKFTQSGKQYFLHISPFKDQYGLNWLVVTVIPESDFSEQAYKIYTRHIIILSGIVLLGAIGLATVTARASTRSLLRLNTLIKNLAKNNFELVKTISNITEVKELTESFNQMAQQLQQSYETMRSLNQELADKEAYVTNLLEMLPIGVALHDQNGTVTYLNQVAKQLLKIESIPLATREELSNVYNVYQVGTNELYPPENIPALRALEGETVLLENLEIHLPHAEIIILEVNATPVFNQQGEIISSIVAFQDITLRQQAEQLLSRYNRELEAEVQQRTLALEKEIQERQKTEAALRESETRFREAFATAAVGMAIVSLEGKFIQVNASLCEMFGYEEMALLKLSVEEVTYPEDLELDLELVRQIIIGKIAHYHLEKRYIHRNGHLIWGLLSVALIRNPDQQPLYVIAQVQNITAQKEAEAALLEANRELEHLIRIDPLTQVPNRRYFDEYFQQEWQRGIREEQPLSLILLDVDYFKRYNDYYGHPAGDRCLAAVAQAVKQSLKRPADQVARYGGEEFAVILPHTALEGGMIMAKQIQDSLQQFSLPHKRSPISNCVTVSLGISCIIPSSFMSSERLIIQADQALYQAKQQGRNRYAIY